MLSLPACKSGRAPARQQDNQFESKSMMMISNMAVGCDTRSNSALRQPHVFPDADMWLGNAGCAHAVKDSSDIANSEHFSSSMLPTCTQASDGTWGRRLRRPMALDPAGTMCCATDAVAQASICTALHQPGPPNLVYMSSNQVAASPRLELGTQRRPEAATYLD